MKKYITNFLRKKKGVGEFAAKVLTLGNLKRVISILLLLSMLITSNAVSTLAGSKPQKYGSSETANETEKETTPTESGEFYAESKNDNELNGIDEDIKIDDKKVGSENDKIDNTNETENENNENTNSDNETINKNEKNIVPTDDENKTDNEYDEEKEEDDDEDNGSKGSQRFAPTNGETNDNETNDNETNDDEGSQSFAPTNGDTNDNETNDNETNDNEGTEVSPLQNNNTNDSDTNDNEATGSEADSSEITETENKVDENLTNYIDLFIKNAKTGQTENNWKIVKVLMKNTEDAGEDISLLDKDEILDLFKIAIFHYLFGYIHPFYDGNGRTSRFISSYLLSKCLEPIISFRISYTIQENIKQYYEAFKICNDPRNKGDLTPFLFMFIEIIEQSMQQLHEALSIRAKYFEHYSDAIELLPNSDNKKYCRIYYLLVQASLFSENGITIKELIENTDESRSTVLNRLKEISKHDLLVEKKPTKEKHFSLDLNKVDNIILSTE